MYHVSLLIWDEVRHWLLKHFLSSLCLKKITNQLSPFSGWHLFTCLLELWGDGWPPFPLEPVYIYMFIYRQPPGELVCWGQTVVHGAAVDCHRLLSRGRFKVLSWISVTGCGGEVNSLKEAFLISLRAHVSSLVCSFNFHTRSRTNVHKDIWIFYDFETNQENYNGNFIDLKALNGTFLLV